MGSPDIKAVAFVSVLAMLAGSFASAMTPDDILTMSSVQMEDLSPDGRFLLYELTTPDNDNLSQLHTVYRRDLESGRDLEIFSPEDDGMWPTFSPDAQSIGYVRGGKSGLEFWIMDADGGHRRAVAEVPQNINSFQWSPDASFVAWIEVSQSYDYEGVADEVVVAEHIGYRHLNSGYREGRLAQIYYLDLAEGRVHQVTSGAYDVRSFSWAPDSRQLVYSAKSLADLGVNLNTNLWVISIDGEQPVLITTNPGGDDSPQWLGDGRIAWLRRENPIWESAPSMIAVSSGGTGDQGPFETHGTGFDNFITRFCYDAGNFYVIGANRGALDLVKVQGDQYQILTNSRHNFWSLDIAAGKAIMQGAGQMLPSALFAFDLDDDFSRPAPPEIVVNPHEDWVLRTGLTTPGHFIINVEGRDVEGWYYLPVNLEKNELLPVVLSIHGGPEWMYGGYFLPEFHILPTFGYAVIITNPTGSLGYGLNFQQDIQGDWVGRPARELMACLDWAEAQGWADPDHMAVMGGSYGGHLAAALTTQTDRFQAAAIDRMVPDLVTFWGTTDEKWFPQWEFQGNPWDDDAREVYARNSPMNFVGSVRTPTLISQGLKDYRCLIAGGEMWFSALKTLGVPARLLRFADEGHGLRSSQNKVFYYHELLAWFDEHILNNTDEEMLPETHE